MEEVNQIDNKRKFPPQAMARHGSSNPKDPKLPKGMNEKGSTHA